MKSVCLTLGKEGTKKVNGGKGYEPVDDRKDEEIDNWMGKWLIKRRDTQTPWFYVVDMIIQTR